MLHQTTVPWHDAHVEFTLTALPFSRGFFFARARILCPFNLRCASATLTADLELAQAPPPPSATNLGLFPSAQELPAQDQLKLLVLTPRCPERARIIHAERGRDRGLC